MEKITKKEKFIKKSEKLYSDNYDYSFVDYIDSKTKVKIICIKHNIIFYQEPAEHIRGRKACNLCKKNPKYTNSLFIEKSQKFHGNKYDYFSSNYIDSETKIKIICPEHGEFKQLPISHISGQGCPMCGAIKRRENKKLNKKEFIEKAKKKHGDKYNYSSVNYIDSYTKIKIICPKHGIFEQVPSKHIRGQGFDILPRLKFVGFLSPVNQLIHI